jgi:uridine kinase
MTRAALIERLAEAIESVARPHPIRVAIDGPDAAGKTTLADELAALLRDRGRSVIRASIDGFHRPRAERYRAGEASAQGYYEDSFQYDALRHALLEPLRPGGNRTYRTAVFDHRADAAAETAPSRAPDDAILLLDGVFLLRPELAGSWDLRIFVLVGFDEVLRRALERDRSLFATAAELERRYRSRYIPGQQLYYAVAKPEESADLVVDNDDPDHPRLRVRSAPDSPAG